MKCRHCRTETGGKSAICKNPVCIIRGVQAKNATLVPNLEEFEPEINPKTGKQEVIEIDVQAVAQPKVTVEVSQPVIETICAEGVTICTSCNAPLTPTDYDDFGICNFCHKEYLGIGE